MSLNGVDLGKGPVRIGLISDTHIPRDVKILPPHVQEAFRGVDLILHAGDIYLPRVLDELETIAPVLAARGNGDREFPQDHRLKETQVISIAGLKLGITHGEFYPRPPDYSIEKMAEREFGESVDVIVFGDSHVALVERVNSVLLVNPGSPALPNGRYELGTVGLLEITGNRAEARIVQLSEFPIPFHKETVFYRGSGA